MLYINWGRVLNSRVEEDLRPEIRDEKEVRGERCEVRSQSVRLQKSLFFFQRLQKLRIHINIII